MPPAATKWQFACLRISRLLDSQIPPFPPWQCLSRGLSIAKSCTFLLLLVGVRAKSPRRAAKLPDQTVISSWGPVQTREKIKAYPQKNGWSRKNGRRQKTLHCWRHGSGGGSSAIVGRLVFPSPFELHFGNFPPANGVAVAPSERQAPPWPRPHPRGANSPTPPSVRERSLDDHARVLYCCSVVRTSTALASAAATLQLFFYCLVKSWKLECFSVGQCAIGARKGGGGGRRRRGCGCGSGCGGGGCCGVIQLTRF